MKEFELIPAHEDKHDLEDLGLEGVNVLNPATLHKQPMDLLSGMRDDHAETSDKEFPFKAVLSGTIVLKHGIPYALS